MGNIKLLTEFFIESKRNLLYPANEKTTLVSLRIDAKTIIQVTPDKCNEEYAQLYRDKRNNK
jgi:hypothetical protein